MITFGGMKQILNFYKTIVAYAIIAIFITTACNSNKRSEGNIQDKDTIGMLVTQIKSCSRLYTAECKVHKIITHNDDIKIKGKLFNKDFEVPVPLTERKIAIPMDATFKAYIDFEKISQENIKRSGKKIEILLPYPQIVMTSSNIDHKSIKRDVRFSRRTFSDEELTQYANQGRMSIIENIQNSAIIETAKRGAANIIIPMIKQLGYDEENITIVFDESDRHPVENVNKHEIATGKSE